LIFFLLTRCRDDRQVHRFNATEKNCHQLRKPNKKCTRYSIFSLSPEWANDMQITTTSRCEDGRW